MLSENKYTFSRNQKEKLLQMPTCSLHADIHHGLLLHAYITPPVRYRALREQYKLVTTHCHSSWRTWSSTQRAGDQASITVSHAVLLQCKPALLINPGAPELFPWGGISQNRCHPPSPVHTHTEQAGPRHWTGAHPLPQLQRGCRQRCCTARATWHTALLFTQGRNKQFSEG